MNTGGQRFSRRAGGAILVNFKQFLCKNQISVQKTCKICKICKNYEIWCPWTPCSYRLQCHEIFVCSRNFTSRFLLLYLQNNIVSKPKAHSMILFWDYKIYHENNHPPSPVPLLKVYLCSRFAASVWFIVRIVTLTKLAKVILGDQRVSGQYRTSV